MKMIRDSLVSAELGEFNCQTEDMNMLPCPHPPNSCPNVYGMADGSVICHRVKLNG